MLPNSPETEELLGQVKDGDAAAVDRLLARSASRCDA